MHEICQWPGAGPVRTPMLRSLSQGARFERFLPPRSSRPTAIVPAPETPSALAASALTRPARQRLARRLTAPVLAGLMLIVLAAVGPAQEAPIAPPALATPTATALAEAGRQELDRLARHDGTIRSRQQMLLRNLSRYYVRYLVPSSPEELSRVLGTLERMVRSAGFAILSATAQAANGEAVSEPGEEPASEITSEHVRAVAERILPSRVDRDSRVFFPTGFPSDFPSGGGGFPTDGGAPGQPVAIELVDLEALRDSGLAAETLLALAQAAQQSGLANPLEPGAVEALAEAINAYALLVLRLGGLHARLELAEALGSRHFREAGKSIAGRAVPADPLAPPGGDDAPAHPGRLFEDATSEAGLAFDHRSSPWLARFRRYGRTAPTFSGGGVSAGDLDGNSFLDLVICGGSGCRFFAGGPEGRFEDRTAASGLGIEGEARMALLADFDSDGTTDVFVTYARDTNRLFRGLGGGRFEDVTAASGLEREGDVSGPAAAVDVDNDGLLDLYVGNFGDYLAGENPWAPNNSRNAQSNRLYRNLGGLRFEDATEAAGVGDTGWTQALSHADLDRDGDQDLYVANDFGPNELFVNRGDGTFAAAGTASGSDDRFHGMNASFTDLNGDRYPDVFITNIWFRNAVSGAVTETNTLLLSEPKSDGSLGYRRHEDEAFLAHDTGWSWAAVFLDLENDGDQDLFVANGFTDYLTFIQYRPHPEIPSRMYPINNGREPNRMFRNDSGIPSVPIEGEPTDLAGRNTRSALAFDYDGDHDLDLVATTFHGPAVLFRNLAAEQGRSGNWLEVDLVGSPEDGVNRAGIGAQISAEAGAWQGWRAITGGEGYLGMGPARAYFGLGSVERVDLEILWPNGARQTVPGVAANQRLRIAYAPDAG